MSAGLLKSSGPGKSTVTASESLPLTVDGCDRKEKDVRLLWSEGGVSLLSRCPR